MLIFLAFANIDDKRKFDYLYNRYSKLMLYKAYAVLHDYSLAEDAVSEAFIRIYKNLDKIDDCDAGKTAAFLVIITRNCALTILSKRQRDNPANIDDLDLSAPGDVEDTIISECSAQDIMHVIESLKENLKEPFLLKYAYNMSHKEIAKILGQTENNVTVRIHRAKTKLAQLLQKGGYHGERTSKQHT